MVTVVEVETLIKIMEIWRYIVLFLFYILTNIIAFHFGFRAGATMMYNYCVEQYEIEEQEEEFQKDE